MSYSRADRALVDQIIHGLRAVGVEVWWDEDMHGVDWQEELERQISELGGVMVLWTANSANSKHVRDEARLGLETDKLINVLSGVPKPPFPYDRINGLSVDGWNGRDPHRGWSRLVATVEEMLVASGGAEPGQVTGALARREEDFRSRQQAVATAQEVFQDAQAREGEATEAAKTAATALASAEEQLQRVAEMRASSLLLRAAQQEAEVARAAKDDADKDLRAAKGALSDASRALTRANSALESLFSQSSQAPKPAAQPPRPIDDPVTRATVAARRASQAEAKAEAPPATAPEAKPEPAAAKTASVAETVVTAEPSVPPAQKSAAASATATSAAAGAATTSLGQAAAANSAGAAGSTGAASGTETGIGTKPAAKRGPNLWLYIGGGLAAAVVLVIVLAGHPHPTPSPPSSSDSSAASAASGASGRSTASSQAAASLAGNWAPQGLTCDNPITLAVSDGVLSLTSAGKTSTATIESVSDSGEIQAMAADGLYTYSVDSEGLSVAGPGGSVMKMTKCAG